MADKVEWVGNELYSEIRFGPLVLQAYQDPVDETKYRHMIGGDRSQRLYTTLNGAQLAGLNALKKACNKVLQNIDPFITKAGKIFKEAQEERLERGRGTVKKNRKKPKPASILDV